MEPTPGDADEAAWRELGSEFDAATTFRRMSELKARSVRLMGYKGDHPQRAWEDALRVKYPNSSTMGVYEKESGTTWLGVPGIEGGEQAASVRLCDDLAAEARNLKAATMFGVGTDVLTRRVWLDIRLRERGWNKHDIKRHDGPDHKTIQKILDGRPVRPDILEKLAKALSKKGTTVQLTDIPSRL